MAKALQRIGLLALVLWTLLGLLAWGLAAKEVRIVFEERQGTAAGDQELEQLRDRVETVTRDLRGLSEAVEANFESMLGQLEAQEAELSALARTRRSPATPAEPAPMGVLPVPVESALGAAAEPDSSRPANSEQPPAEPEPTRTKSFLSFTLPSEDFAFDEERTFRILESLSRVGFDGKSTLHDFTGVSDRPEGQFTVNLARPEVGIRGEVSIRAAGLATGSDGRDSEMYDHLAVEEHERIRFQFDGFESDRIDASGERTKGRVLGRMTIHGTEREVSMAVEGYMDASRRLVIEGEMPLLMSEYGVPVPNKLGMISMEDEVRVWVHLLARPVPKGSKVSDGANQ